MLQGVGVAFLILRDARATRDRTFLWIGAMTLISYACYIPVVFFVQRISALGMLMIPKTLAYLVIGFLAYRVLYSGRLGRPSPSTVTGSMGCTGAPRGVSHAAAKQSGNAATRSDIKEEDCGVSG
jgi:hypothetical protein